MVTTRAGHAKKRAAELAASIRQYQHPPSYDHDVDGIGLSFAELKQRQIEQALIENPPPPFNSSDDDDKTIDAVEVEDKKDKNQSSKLAIKKDPKKQIS